MSAVGAATPRATTATTEHLDRGVWRSTLPGGPVVLTERMPSVRSVAVGVWFRHGAAHERPGERGISHLLEHAVFKGTGTRSAREIALDIERLGGSLDAFTTHEYTSFQARVPDVHLDAALDVLADLCFRPALRPADVELERNVVLEEIARVEDTPEDLVFERHAERLYGDHPYGAPILGTTETVGRLDAETLRRLHATAYVPGNAVIAAAGRVRHERLRERLEALLPERAGSPPAGVAAAPGPRPERRVEVRPGGRQTHVVVGVPGVPHSHPLRHPLILVSTALGGGMSSRLFQSIREERGLAYSVYSFHAFYSAAGHAGAYLGTQPETSARAGETLLGELSRLAREGLGSEELECARRQLRGQLHLALESTVFRMERLAAQALHDEPYRSVEETGARIAAITAEEAAEAAALFDPGRATVLELAPE